MIEPDMLAILACPICEDRPPLQEVGDKLKCTKCMSLFPVVDGIPHLVADEAETPSKKETE